MEEKPVTKEMGSDNGPGIKKGHATYDSHARWTMGWVRCRRSVVNRDSGTVGAESSAGRQSFEPIGLKLSDSHPQPHQASSFNSLTSHKAHNSKSRLAT